MPTVNELTEVYRRLSSDELIRIVPGASSDLTPEALGVFRSELAQRGLDELLDSAAEDQVTETPATTNFLSNHVSTYGLIIFGLFILNIVAARALPLVETNLDGSYGVLTRQQQMQELMGAMIFAVPVMAAIVALPIAGLPFKGMPYSKKYPVVWILAIITLLGVVLVSGVLQLWIARLGIV